MQLARPDQGLPPREHREVEIDRIAFGPHTLDPAERSLLRGDALAVHSDARALGPRRDPNRENERARLLRVYDESRACGLGEARDLLHANALVADDGRNEQIDGEDPRTAQVRAFGRIGEALDHRAVAAPEAVGRRAPVLLGPALGQGEEVDEHARLRVLCRQEPAVEAALEHVAIASRALERQKIARHLHPVVGRARLLRGRAERVVELARRPPDFAAARASRGEDPRGGDDGVRVPQHHQRFLVAKAPVKAAVAVELGKLRVSVNTGELVFSAGKRIDDGMVPHTPGKARVARVAGREGQLRERFHDSAVLAIEHSLELAVGQRLAALAEPVGKRANRGQRLLVAGQSIHVDEPGHELVDAVVRRRDDFEGRITAVLAFHDVDTFRSPGLDPASAVGDLALAQPRDNRVRLLHELLVFRRGDRARGAGQPVPEERSAVRVERRLPAPRRRAGVAQARREPVAEKQHVGIEALEIAEIGLECPPEQALAELHFAGIEGLEATKIGCHRRRTRRQRDRHRHSQRARENLHHRRSSSATGCLQE